MEKLQQVVDYKSLIDIIEAFIDINQVREGIQAVILL